jgi:hypothetical protein
LARRGPLEAYAARLVETLAARLARSGYQAQGLRVALALEASAPLTETGAVEPPTADAARLTRRALALLAGLHLAADVTDELQAPDAAGDDLAGRERRLCIVRACPEPILSRIGAHCVLAGSGKRSGAQKKYGQQPQQSVSYCVFRISQLWPVPTLRSGQASRPCHPPPSAG